MMSLSVKRFQDSDLQRAKELSHLVWGDFYNKESAVLQSAIYDFTVEYYDLNREFSYSLSDETCKGFLFAFYKKDKNDSLNTLNRAVQALENDGGKSVLLELYEFLQDCGHRTQKQMSANDLMLGLFVSTRKGGGSMLLNALIQQGKKQGIKNLYLWSDTTCDYDYYSKHQFELVDTSKTVLNNQEVTVFVYKKGLV